jgi:hypothetical protein
MLEQSGLGDEVELEVAHGQIIIRASARPRAGWEDPFRLMADQGDDAPLDFDLDTSGDWDDQEWRW